jgi:hypothetical protein
VGFEGKRYKKHLEHVVLKWKAISRPFWICIAMTTIYPLVKSLIIPSRLQIQKLTFTVGDVSFYSRVHCCHFSANSVRAFVVWQLLCKTYALGLHGWNVMVHGVLTFQYQRYGEKILMALFALQFHAKVLPVLVTMSSAILNTDQL